MYGFNPSYQQFNMQPMNGMQQNFYPDKYQQQNLVNNQQTNDNSQPFLIVSNMKEAQEKIIGYNTCMWMRDPSEPYLYVKSTDMTGTPHFSVLKLEDVTDQMLNDNGQFKETEKFVPIQDFNALNSKVDQLQNTVNYCSGVLNQVLTPQAQQNNTVIDVEPKEVKKIGRPTKTEKVGEANG